LRGKERWEVNQKKQEKHAYGEMREEPREAKRGKEKGNKVRRGVCVSHTHPSLVSVLLRLSASLIAATPEAPNLFFLILCSERDKTDGSMLITPSDVDAPKVATERL